MPGRAVYLACFPVAQAIIFQREGRVLKTHRGVQTEFNRIMKDDPRADVDLVGFMARAHKFKTAADFRFDTPIHQSDEDPRNAIPFRVLQLSACAYLGAVSFVLN
jgi:uncharacterized protein (UPF0332 family)